VDHEVESGSILDGFNPEDDPIDRRLLFEVTGLRLFAEEFQETGSSDLEEDEEDIAPDWTDPDQDDSGTNIGRPLIAMISE